MRSGCTHVERSLQAKRLAPANSHTALAEAAQSPIPDEDPKRIARFAVAVREREIVAIGEEAASAWSTVTPTRGLRIVMSAR